MSTPSQRTFTDAVVPSGRTVSSFGTGEEAARKVRADQRLCWQKGQRVRAEDYLRWAPHLGDDPEVLLDIVYAEFLLCEEYGDRPDPEQFVLRFPQFEAQLRRQFLLHAVLGDGTVVDVDGDAPTDSAKDHERTIVSLPDDGSGLTNIEDPDAVVDDRTVVTEYAEPLDGPDPSDLGPGATPEVPIPRSSNADTASQPTRRAALSKIKSALLTWPGADDVLDQGNGQAFVAGYEILGELGRGAVGVVYKAKQRGLNRVVALKMILAGTHASRQALKRFRAEAEAVARLKHPNIVQIYDIGESDGLPYFSLEFCAGGPLSGHLDGTPLPSDEAARIIETLAHAMHYAHEHGIVHRDLKPANVLVTGECDVRTGKLLESANLRSGEWGESVTEVPLATGLKIADFGLAKRLDESSQTKTGAVLGTPSYMAPEQASGHIHDVTPLADVYALGTILYELLTGRPPFRAATAIDTVMQVINEEPVPPRRLQSRVPEDLETITLKCLEKDKAKRYSSAEALAEDLARFQKREPILARPVGPVGRAYRWCRRNPVVASLTGAVAVLLVAGTVVSAVLAHKADVQRGNAEKNAAEAKTESGRAKRNLYVAQMNLAQRAWQDLQMARLRDMLDNQTPERTGIDLRGFEWHYWDRKAHADLAACKGHDGPVESVAYSPDSRELATGGKDGTVRLWSAAGGALRAKLDGHTGPVVGVAYLPGGRLASASAIVIKEGGVAINAVELFVWDLAGRRTVFRAPPAPVDELHALAASPDGARLATASAEGVRLWDARTGVALPLPADADGNAASVAFSADGALAAGFDVGARVWPADGGAPSWLPVPNARVHGVGFSPDGKRLYAAGGLRDPLQPDLSREGILTEWDWAAKEQSKQFAGRFGRVLALGVSLDGKSVVTASDDSALRFWDIETGDELAMTQGHGGPINAMALTRDGRCLATASDDGTAKTWDAHPWPEPTFLPPRQSEVRVVAHLPGGRIVTGGFSVGDGEKTRPWLTAWDAESGRPLVQFQGLHEFPLTVAASSDGSRMVVIDRNRTMQLFDTATGRPVAETVLDERNDLNLAYLPDGRIAAFSDRKIVVWDGTTPPKVVRAESEDSRLIRAVAAGADGETLVAVSTGRIVRVERLDGERVAELAGHTEQVNSVAFGPGCRSVATGSQDRTVRLWDLPSGAALHVLRGHTYEVTGLAFDPTGRRLASAGRGYDLTARVWDTATGQEVLSLPGGEGLTFSPDGHWLAAVGAGSLRLWDARPESPERAARRGAIQVLRFLSRTVPDVAAARKWLTNDPPIRSEVRDAAAAVAAEWYRDER